MDQNEFNYARDGDHLMVGFQCDLCIFRRLRKRDPEEIVKKDRNLLAYIRRANLDAFWSRSPATVAQNKYRVRRSIKDLNDELGITDGPFYDHGPYPNYDSEGYTVAYSVLLASRRSGRYEETHSQWQTIRHVKGAIGNYERTAPSGLALVDMRML